MNICSHYYEIVNNFQAANKAGFFIRMMWHFSPDTNAPEYKDIVSDVKFRYDKL